MGENSGIAWTDHTFNPWIGCTKVGPGCDHCYAEAYDNRFSGGAHWGTKAPRRRTNIQNWNRVRRWNLEAAIAGIRPRVFCASLADVFDNEVPPGWREDLWKLIDETPYLDWILVTKRVGNVSRMAPDTFFPSNVILLATIVDQPEADRDLNKLVDLKKRGIVRKIGVSYEPALGPVDWSPWLRDLDWLIVGGESSQNGAEARMFMLEWAENSIELCRSAGVPIFIKQLGSTPAAEVGSYFWFAKDHIMDRAAADPSEWPEELRVRQFPVIGGKTSSSEMETVNGR